MNKHSPSQQALADLEAISGCDPRERRRQVFDRIPQRGPPLPPPLAAALSANVSLVEDLIRADRDTNRSRRIQGGP